jgi:hypothetical protein
VWQLLLNDHTLRWVMKGPNDNIAQISNVHNNPRAPAKARMKQAWSATIGTPRHTFVAPRVVHPPTFYSISRPPVSPSSSKSTPRTSPLDPTHSQLHKNTCRMVAKSNPPMASKGSAQQIRHAPALVLDLIRAVLVSLPISGAEHTIERLDCIRADNKR